MTIPVREPQYITEFEVQAYLWNELKRRGINARGEVKTRYAKKAYVRFDIAIFEDGQMTRIIEIKRSKIAHKTSWEDTRQGKRYNEFGVPVNIIYGMEGADEFLGFIDINKFPAMPGKTGISRDVRDVTKIH